MPNNNSALTRSNLGSRSAVAALANIVSPSVIDSLTRRVFDLVVSRQGGGRIPLPEGNSGSGGTRIRINRNKRRRNRGQSQAQIVPRTVGAGVVPSSRRILKGIYAAVSPGSGSAVTTLSWGVGFAGGGAPLISATTFGQQVIDFSKSFSSCTIHRVKVTLTPTVAASAGLTYAIGYSVKGFTSPAVFSDFTGMSVYKVGGIGGNVEFAFAPRNAHGSTVPTVSGYTDDTNEICAGFLHVMLNSTAAAASTALMLTLEADVTFSEL